MSKPAVFVSEVGRRFEYRCKTCGCCETMQRPDLRLVCYCVNPNRDCWGERFERFLSRRGITPAKYRRWKVRWGLADDCDCDGRKEKLNRFGRWAGKPLRRWWKALPPPSPTV